MEGCGKVLKSVGVDGRLLKSEKERSMRWVRDDMGGCGRVWEGYGIV